MKLSDLVDKVEPFRFEYDGFVLEGEYQRYKTSTPNYVKSLLKTLPELSEDGTAAEKAAAVKARDEADLKAGLQVLADTIKSWNAVDDSGSPVPISIETFEALPISFTQALILYFRNLREGNPTSPNSPSS